MKPRYTPKPQMTRAANITAAVMKVSTAPLDKLTDANLESIARSHCGRTAGAYERLLADLIQRRADRMEREAEHG